MFTVQSAHSMQSASRPRKLAKAYTARYKIRVTYLCKESAREDALQKPRLKWSLIATAVQLSCHCRMTELQMSPFQAASSGRPLSVLLSAGDTAPPFIKATRCCKNAATCSHASVGGSR